MTKELIKKLENKKILLTGATGMLGTAIIRMLTNYNQQYNTNIQITGISRSEKRAKERLSDFMGLPEFTYVAADINVPLLDLGTFDYIIHAASNTHPRQYATDPIGTIATNVWGTKNLLDYMVEHKCGRFVFLSSVEIYGENRGDYRDNNLRYRLPDTGV